MWCLLLPGPDDELQPSIIELLQVLCREHAGISSHDHILHTMPVLEGFDHGNDRVRLCLRSLEAPDLEWEPGPIDEETDDNLRVDATFFRVPDSAQLVFLLSLEVQGCHVVAEEADSGGRDAVIRALPRNE